MHCRKLHAKDADKKKLYDALKALYRDGVRIPMGKPYALRQRSDAGKEQDSKAGEDPLEGLELVRDEGPDTAGGSDPYGRTPDR